ncbi:sodium:solute symporter family transporter [Halocatena pleomorpha]|uniref:Sodium:proline symporter n=1 Tax=Halocatena pleomorpha TaxID=1785090 RepID=A0A3P3RJM4_9EURY|nr:sodium:proline symporter [Halocatena pleomorpha]RRJ33612.1 sodium:proline symporter [Halocatena pleomorpha]
MISSSVALGVTALVVGGVSVVGMWFVRGRIGSVEDYISARDSAGTGTLTATLVASSMGAWILLSPAEAGAAFGGITAVLGYAVGSAVPMVIYAVIGPRIRELIPAGHTLTEYTYARFGRLMYGYVLLVSVGYMFVFLAAEMTGITGALSLVAGVPMWQTALLIGGFVLAYTTYGGLRASIFTDTVQALVILPLLAVSFGVALLELGGTRAVYESVVASNPQLLDLGFAVGVESGVYIAVSVLGAEMLNQAWWQRVYAAENKRVLTRSFLVTAVAVVPMIFVAGLFGLAAQGLGLVEGNASIAFFLVTTEVFPDTAVLGIVILAVLLVMSSADTLFNAISSIVTADLPRILDPGEKTLTTSARVLTVIVALAAIVIGAQGYSVLTLFFVADLLAVATFIPLLTGLYARRLSGHGALLASLTGLLVGVLFFPIARPLLSALEPSLPAATYLRSFLGAAIVSGGVTALAAAVGRSRIDFDRLDRTITRFDHGVDDTGGDER